MATRKNTESCISFHIILLLTVVKALTAIITITSSPQLGVDTICDNQTLTLTCHTDQQVKNITWYWSNQSKHGDTITVVATLTEILYTCVASDGNGTLSKANITVVANGAPPVIVKSNFYNYLYLSEGSNRTLITEITSKPILSRGSPIWHGFNRYLPQTAKVDKHTVDGKTRSTIKLYNLSYDDDSGEYINTAKNKCGSSSVSVFIFVERTSSPCSNNNRVPSLVSGPQDLAAVKGSYVSFSCLYNGTWTVPVGPSSVYWIIAYGSTQEKIINNSTYYHVATYQTCLNEELSCCQFVTKLMVYNATAALNNATVTCYEFLQETGGAISTATAKATLSVLPLPEVTKGPHNVTAKLSQNVKFVCEFRATTLAYISIVEWLKDGFDKIPSTSTHYIISVNDSLPTNGLVEEQNDHFVSTLTILNITYEDEGKYTCYVYYNATLVTSNTHDIVRSNLKSANLYVTSNNNKNSFFSSQLQLYATISASVAVIISVIIIWVIGIAFYKQHRIRPQLVNLPIATDDYGSDSYHSDDDDLTDTQPLLKAKDYETCHDNENKDEQIETVIDP